MFIRLLLLCAATLFAPSAMAQGRDGSDTAGAWAPTFTARHGPWDVTCDRRDSTDRCYIRYIDVFSPRPDFGVLFAFIAWDGGPIISFGREFETPFLADAMSVTGTDWRLPETLCRAGACEITGGDADALLRALATVTDLPSASPTRRIPPAPAPGRWRIFPPR